MFFFPPCFKGDNFYDFLVASLEGISALQKGSTFKGSAVFLQERFFLYRSVPFEREARIKMVVASPENVTFTSRFFLYLRYIQKKNAFLPNQSDHCSP